MPDDPHEHADGCLCDLDQTDHPVTEDHDLPAAVGGVEGPRRRRRARSEGA